MHRMVGIAALSVPNKKAPFEERGFRTPKWYSELLFIEPRASVHVRRDSSDVPVEPHTVDEQPAGTKRPR